MTKPNDNELFAKMLAKNRSDKAAKLAEAKSEAATRGKQAFDLDELEAIYDTRTDTGFLPARAERERDYEYRYYVTYRDTMTLAEFAAKQSAIDAGTDVKP